MLRLNQLTALFYLTLNQPFRVLGTPCKNSNASGAAQLAQRSIKSQIGCPAIGLNSAVQKPQIQAQTKIALIGQNNAIIATITSIIPIRGNKVWPKLSLIPTAVKYGSQEAFVCRANTPCPKKLPKTPNLKIPSAVVKYSLIFINKSPQIQRNN